jgi:nucleotide-binding universal stress UspA family protein
MTALDPGGPVICAYEDKPIARHALRASAWLANALETALVVAHVFDPMGIRVPPTRDMLAASVTTDDLERSARRRAQRQLDAAAQRVSGTGAEAELVEDQPVAGLLELAAGRGARLLVTGTAARVGLDRILIGSVTSDLAARSPCPVIAVPRAAALEEPGPVLAGYDGSDHGLRAARHAAALAAQLDRDLVLVHVAKPGDEVVRPDRELAGELYVAASEGRLSEPGQPLDLSVSVVRESGDPADTLVRVARERAAAVIFTGTRGRNALSSALLGSVSAGVVSVADRPVGLVPASVRDSAG